MSTYPFIHIIEHGLFLYVCCQSYQSNVHFLSSWSPTMAKAIVTVTGAEARRRTIALYYLMNIIYSRHICRNIMTAHFRNFYRCPLNLKGTMENWGPSLNPFKSGSGLQSESAALIFHFPFFPRSAAAQRSIRNPIKGGLISRQIKYSKQDLKFEICQ